MPQKINPSVPLFERFLHSQSAGSLALLLATISAVFWANSPWAEIYESLSHLDIGTYIGGNLYHLTLAHWVKDGLMTVFFFVVGLEIKREILIGELSSWRKAILPVMAALGGAIFPAALYFFLNPNGQEAAGWGIPMATDIAFALGVLALFGSRVPTGLKVFLTALAIVDDLMAVLVIAIFYTEQIAILPLVIVVFLLTILGIVIRRGVRRPGIHLLLFLGIWLCILTSGVHATIAGVLVALLYPVKASISPETFYQVIKDRIAHLETTNLTTASMIDNKQQLRAINQIYLAAEDMIPAGIFLEENLHSIQAFLILPLFALFSAGVVINMETFQGFPNSLSLGVIFGLVLGKQIGILSFSYLVVKSKLAELAKGTTWSQIWGVSILSGIGFTMSIFISELAFTDDALIGDAKIAIFIASILSALWGYIVLHRNLPAKGAERG
ncbi:Na+/H+ antiporter NhaA [Desulfogranum japonicum]|uniref:Na+/H+ antiporter NhaA n=1 Tax=Desulfogranum japonicum TaxID=231447 RepID=UPI0003F7BEDD|nr:Na+/H+ antiporter NhaA [Desulfogranum japonicum]